jgi:ligand-binding sensor domain-containing protein
MPASSSPQTFSLLAIPFLLVLAVLTYSLDQNSQSSPSPSPSPTASATPTPLRTPSPTPLPGAQNFHQWGSITVFNGLPSDSVRAVSQTLDGIMWFGTDNSLARFDGRRIQNFSLGGADADRILALKTAPTGELWIGTRAGAFVYSDGRFQPVADTQNIGITSILLGSEIRLGTDAGLVLRVTPKEDGTYTVEKISPDPIEADDGNAIGITSLVENEGRLLAATAGRGVFVVKDNALSEFPSTPRPIFVNSLAQSSDGKLWFGAEAAKGVSGIYLVEDGTRARRITAPTADVQVL